MIWLDLERWRRVRRLQGSRYAVLVYLLTYYPEFRSQVYWRLGYMGHFFWALAKGHPGVNLLMDSRMVGPGLYIQHGDGVFVSCERIGRNAWVSQQVTLGYSNETDRPRVGDDVKFYSGAKVLGSVTIGDRATIGANAVVLRNVASDALVTPPMSRTIA